MPYKQGVVGSSPAAPTTNLQVSVGARCSSAHSSRTGGGRAPIIVVGYWFFAATPTRRRRPVPRGDDAGASPTAAAFVMNGHEGVCDIGLTRGGRAESACRACPPLVSALVRAAGEGLQTGLASGYRDALTPNGGLRSPPFRER